MAEKHGIDNMKKVLDLGLEAGNVAGHWASPGGQGAMELLRLTDEAMALSTVDWKLLDDEFKDISDAELAELNAHAATKLDIPQDGIEGIVEKAWSIGIHQGQVVKECFDMAGMIKALKSDPVPA